MNSEENLETLQEYIDWCFDVIVMKKNQNACSPVKSETPSSKRSRPADSPETTSPTGKSFTDILDSIDKRLSSFDARLSLVEILHREFKSLRGSLEFSQQQVETLAAENASLRDSVKSLTENVTHLNEENKKIKETVIDLQARSMRDNLVFSGIPESAEEDAEATVKSFIKTYLKLPEDTVENICFERVHRLGAKKPGAPRPCPIVAKFGYFKQKEQVKSRGRELKGTDFSVNDQFPKEILERRKVLFPIRRSLIQKGSRAVIAVDRLYVDGRLYRDLSTTPCTGHLLSYSHTHTTPYTFTHLRGTTMYIYTQRSNHSDLTAHTDMEDILAHKRVHARTYLIQLSITRSVQH
ncbi:hypothetical protein M9458_052754 [Cirrhinus mrigala]|uniref:Uncharacterized protein n=1 Tax=Cirrhinus mrigala TaxID=683832 RepID=A0ABD0MT39_CIRMR